MGSGGVVLEGTYTISSNYSYTNSRADTSPTLLYSISHNFGKVPTDFLIRFIPSSAYDISLSAAASSYHMHPIYFYKRYASIDEVSGSINRTGSGSVTINNILSDTQDRGFYVEATENLFNIYKYYPYSTKYTFAINKGSIAWCIHESNEKKMQYTEEEFITICQNNKQHTLPIGAIITLSNTEQTQWEVIDVNHDGTAHTVDLMSHTNIHNATFGSNATYSGSLLHTYCNTTVPNAFTNATVKSLIKTMDVVSNGSTLTGQKGKALSCTELGYTGFGAANEGNIYNSIANADNNYGYREGVTNRIWLRSMNASLGYAGIVSAVMGISISSANPSNNSSGVLPVIRF